MLEPARAVADKGFVVTSNFNHQTAITAPQLSQISSSAALFLRAGKAPAVGSIFRNPDLANTYAEIQRDGADAFYNGPIGRDLVQAVDHPPVAPDAAHPPEGGVLTASDLASYSVDAPPPVHSQFRGTDIYSMGGSSQGGTAVGEILNLVQAAGANDMDRVHVLHNFLEASRLTYADRRMAKTQAVRDRLLSPAYTQARVKAINPDHAGLSPAASGITHESGNTNHLVVSDRWGNVVSYTTTISHYAGSAITVPGRGFLLNDELAYLATSTESQSADNSFPPPGSRRTSALISPTIVLRGGKPVLALGSPGAATIPTTVTQILINRYLFDEPLADAMTAPRVSQENKSFAQAEPDFVVSPEGRALSRMGYPYLVSATSDQAGNSAPTIGVAAALEFDGGKITAVGEQSRHGGTFASVVHPEM
jgi:gamma-glutamyltranspeptidase/glutathione hydrolase